MENAKVFGLVEPHLCLACPFGQKTRVRMGDGTIRPAISCRRKDCDNQIHDPEAECNKTGKVEIKPFINYPVVG